MGSRTEELKYRIVGEDATGPANLSAKRRAVDLQKTMANIGSKDAPKLKNMYEGIGKAILNMGKGLKQATGTSAGDMMEKSLKSSEKMMAQVKGMRGVFQDMARISQTIAKDFESISSAAGSMGGGGGGAGGGGVAPGDAPGQPPKKRCLFGTMLGFAGKAAPWALVGSAALGGAKWFASKGEGAVHEQMDMLHEVAAAGMYRGTESERQMGIGPTQGLAAMAEYGREAGERKMDVLKGFGGMGNVGGLNADEISAALAIPKSQLGGMVGRLERYGGGKGGGQNMQYMIGAAAKGGMGGIRAREFMGMSMDNLEQAVAAGTQQGSKSISDSVRTFTKEGGLLQGALAGKIVSNAQAVFQQAAGMSGGPESSFAFQAVYQQVQKEQEAKRNSGGQVTADAVLETRRRLASGNTVTNLQASLQQARSLWGDNQYSTLAWAQQSNLDFIKDPDILSKVASTVSQYSPLPTTEGDKEANKEIERRLQQMLGAGYFKQGQFEAGKQQRDASEIMEEALGVQRSIGERVNDIFRWLNKGKKDTEDTGRRRDADAKAAAERNHLKWQPGMRGNIG